MKKIVILILILALMLSMLCGCGVKQPAAVSEKPAATTSGGISSNGTGTTVPNGTAKQGTVVTP